MSLNCLSCQRTNSGSGHPREIIYEEIKHEEMNGKAKFGPWFGEVERSWSGNLAPRPYKKMSRDCNDTNPGSVQVHVQPKKMKKDTRRHYSSASFDFGSGQPKLVRSSGMRRDWSFEDLRQAMQTM